MCVCVCVCDEPHNISWTFASIDVPTKKKRKRTNVNDGWPSVSIHIKFTAHMCISSISRPNIRCIRPAFSLHLQLITKHPNMKEHPRMEKNESMAQKQKRQPRHIGSFKWNNDMAMINCFCGFFFVFFSLSFIWSERWQLRWVYVWLRLWSIHDMSINLQRWCVLCARSSKAPEITSTNDNVDRQRGMI